MKIGNVELESNVFLAPMAGVTDKPYREICREFGAGMVYSEMISAKGLHYGDKKTASLMDMTGESPCAIQIFGSEPEIIAGIIPKVMEYKPDIIDINMGCPAPKIVNNGDGSALMKNPELMGRIVRAAADASAVPVTVKLRKGWETDNSLLCAHILEENGAAAVAVHGRTRKEFYSGSADWDVIKRIKSELNIPVVGNGDIFKAEDARRMLEYTGCDAVMVARGAQGNPWIFTQINELLAYGEIKTIPSPREKLMTALKHTERLVMTKGEARGIKEARKHIAWYIKGMPGSGAIKTEIFKISDFATMKEALSSYIDNIL
ncbi:MAG: tRNA dihydrouridine synthase DusB [Clostridiales bacterium]|nr:tRNA dihydrouridine synthase DusB [Clostridiales bacterium]